MTPLVLQRLSAGVYDFFMQPLEQWKLNKIRERLLGLAGGEVLEIGAGSGVNLRYYDPRRVTSLTVSDRNDRTTLYRQRSYRITGTASGPGIPFNTARIDAQRLPFADNSFDTVVATLVFCSVECAPCGFDEIARVLRPAGRYLFLEHVRPRGTFSGRTFDLLNPVWNRISGGCNLNRDTLRAIRDAGFTLRLGTNGRTEADSHGVFVWGEGLLRST